MQTKKNRRAMEQARRTDWRSLALDLVTQTPDKAALSFAGPYLEDIFPGHRVAAIEVQLPLPGTRNDVRCKVVMTDGHTRFRLDGRGNTPGAAVISCVYDGEPIDENTEVDEEDNLPF